LMLHKFLLLTYPQTRQQCFKPIKTKGPKDIP